MGLEPTRPKALVPKTSVAAISPLRQVVGYRLTYHECAFHVHTTKLHPKRETSVYDFFVPPLGLEPRTPMLKAWYSSQLSYEGKFDCFVLRTGFEPVTSP